MMAVTESFIARTAAGEILPSIRESSKKISCLMHGNKYFLPFLRRLHDLHLSVQNKMHDFNGIFFLKNDLVFLNFLMIIFPRIC